MSQNGSRTISEHIVKRVVAALDVAAIFAAGVAAMHWDASGVDWHLAGLVVLLGTIIGVNFLHLAGAYRFGSFARLDGAFGRVLLGWLGTFAALFVATRLFEPVTAADGPWAAAWFSSAFALMGLCRYVLWRRMQHWSRTGRLGEVVAIVGAGAIAQRLLRDFTAGHASLRVIGVYDDDARHLPAHCMGHPIRGTVDDLVNDARRFHVDTVIVALPLSADRQLVETLNRLCLVPVDVRLCPDAFGLRLGAAQASHIAGHTFLNVIDRPLRDWRWTAKEIEDRLCHCCLPSLC